MCYCRRGKQQMCSCHYRAVHVAGQADGWTGRRVRVRVRCVHGVVGHGMCSTGRSCICAFVITFAIAGRGEVSSLQFSSMAQFVSPPGGRGTGFTGSLVVYVYHVVPPFCEYLCI